MKSFVSLFPGCLCSWNTAAEVTTKRTRMTGEAVQLVMLCVIN